MIDMNNLSRGLRELSDAEFQHRTWMASKGPEVSSFSELVSQVFDDTGLADALDAGRCPPELSEISFSVLKELDSAVSRVDQGATPEDLLDNPKVERVRELASQALDLIEKAV
jgi:hypothetical protein